MSDAAGRRVGGEYALSRAVSVAALLRIERLHDGRDVRIEDGRNRLDQGPTLDGEADTHGAAVDL